MHVSFPAGSGRLTTRLRRLIVVSLATVLAFFSLVTVPRAAQATPSPDNGPDTGGTTVTVPAPKLEFTSVSAGRGHSLAIGSDGNTYAWGWGKYGKLGTGSSVDRLIPVKVAAPEEAPEDMTFTSISAGSNHSLAIGSDGNTYAWGSGKYGKLGTGSSVDRLIPVKVAAPEEAPEGMTFTSVSAGEDHSLAIGSDGNIYAWGNGGQGRLGNGNTVTRSKPVKVAAPEEAPEGMTFTSVSAGRSHSLAIGSDGNAYAWGYGGNGRLGNGNTVTRSKPVKVAAPEGAPEGMTFTSVSAGRYHSLAIGSDGNIYAWGQGEYGQLGNDNTSDQSTPVKVTAPEGAPEGMTFASVSAGEYHSLAIGSDGNTYAWGQGEYGQLGNDNTSDQSTPVKVTAPEGMTFASVSAGGLHSLAIGSDGNTYAWGSGYHGQLGNDNSSAQSTPVAVRQIGTITGITFDGIPGTHLKNNGDGTWSVVSPAHGAGKVDVVVSWTFAGVEQTPITYADGFNYFAPNHTVTFEPNNGEGTMAAQVTNTPTALTANTFTRAGHVFAGWNTAADGTGTSYADQAEYSFAENVTLYAQWKEKVEPAPSRTVTFDPNGGEGVMGSQIANTPTALTANAFTRAGHVFAGWNTAADGSGTSYADQAVYPFTENVTLYAQWKEKAATVVVPVKPKPTVKPTVKPALPSTGV